MELFDYVPARSSDPQTSVEAGKAILTKTALIQGYVEDYALMRPDGFTDHELSQHFGNHASTYRTRRAELTDKGVIVPTRQRRALPSGRTAVVWVHHSYDKESKQ